MQIRMMSRYANYSTKDKIFRRIMLGLIVLMSIYIVLHSVNIITVNRAGEKAQAVANTASNMLVNEIVENSSVLTQYMIYMENHDDLTEDVKKQLLKTVVTDYIKGSEYSYDTSDPGYAQVVDLIYDSINTVDKPQTTTVVASTKKPKEKEVANIIVPKPKITGKVYTADNIGSFSDVLSKFYTVTSATVVKESDMPLKKALAKKFEITGKNRKPQILIYHTHSQETFANSNLNDSDTTIIGVGNHLAKILKDQFGFNVIHDTSKYDMVEGVLDRNQAYDQARTGVAKILKKNPTISLVLDVHRDGVNDSLHLATEINGKQTANVMFFNGMSRFRESGDIGYLYNPYLFENLALTLQMKLAAESYYPGFTRHNYVNAYKYNLDLCKQCMLIEVGAQTNTYQEAKNAAEPLAMLIDIVMGKGQ